MLNPVNHFFVGQAIDAAHTAATATVGEICVVSPTGTAVSAATHNGFRIAQKISATGNTNIGRWRYSPIITPDAVRKAFAEYGTVKAQNAQAIAADDIVIEYAAPVAHSINFEDTGGPLTEGTNIYLEIVYKNVRDLSPQFRYDLYSYVCGAASTSANVFASFQNQIEKDPMASTKLTVDTATNHHLIITAKTPPYKLTQRYEWQMISFDASLSYTNAAQSLLNTPAARQTWGTAAPVITKGNEGSGYYCIVSDKEKRALAYQGITNWTAFPVDLPDMFTRATGTYRCIQIPFETSYRSADNITGKGTNELLTIYMDIAGGVTNPDALQAIIVSCCNYA
jgi:hypothetical protein